MVLVTIANAMIDDENDVLQKMTRTSIIALAMVLYIQHVYYIFFQLMGKPAVQ